MRAIFGKSPIFLVMRTGWQYAGRYRPVMIVYLIMFALSQAVVLAEPYVIGKLLNSVQINVGDSANSAKLWHDVCYYASVYFLLEAAVWLFHGPGRVMERAVAYNIRVNYKRHLVKLLTDMPLQWHRDHHSGESIDKVNRASNALMQFFENGCEVSYMLFRFIGAQIILFWFMPAAGWLAFATTLVTVLTVYVFDRYLFKQYKMLNKFENRVTAAIQDYLTNIGSVITLRLENRVLGEVQTRLMAAYSLFKKNSCIAEFKWFLTNMFIAALISSILVWYVHDALVRHQAILAGTFFTLFEYLRRIGDSFFNFTYICGTVVSQTADVQSAETIIDSFAAVPAITVSDLPKEWRTIDISGLNFRYEDEQHREHHLDDVSIRLEKGKSIAFVGESGSGKSTLLSLLRGVQKADRVEVKCDGVPLPGKLAHLSSATTLIPQNPELFTDTIRSNVTFGLEANESELLRAIALAQFSTTLERLPKGLDTNIAEKGVNLSGGEKQRLALARGLFFARDCDILLMDEPTSSVDTLNERLIYSNVLKSYADKCIVSSIHKLHLLDMFDYIYLFANGRLVEHGPLRALLGQNGVLCEMYAAYQLSHASDSDLLESDVDADIVSSTS
jgi:ABC-type multidrug transport system fused ATPase/permease subunit